MRDLYIPKVPISSEQKLIVHRPNKCRLAVNGSHPFIKQMDVLTDFEMTAL